MPFSYPENVQDFFAAVAAAGEKKSFVQVSAAWCGPCQLIKDDMATLTAELDASYAFIYVDVDKCPEVQEAFEVCSMPTFLIFKGPGAPIGKYEGGRFENIKAFAEENKDK